MSLFNRLRLAAYRGVFDLARSLLGRRMVRFVVVKMSFVLPVDTLRRTPALLAFYHPRPLYPVHILIIPRRAVTNLLALEPEDAVFLIDLFETVKSLVVELGLEVRGYRLIANGGAYQDFPLLHFHLVSGTELD